MAHRATHNGRRYSLANKAKALAVILREEFDVAFVSYDAATGVRIGSSETQQCNDTWVALDASTVTELAAGGRAHVALLPYNRYELAIPLYEGGKVVLVAVAALPALVPPGAHATQEQLRLQRWAQSVCDRLRGSDQLLRQRRNEEEQKAQVKMAWEVILTLDHLIRHLRIHKNAAKNQERILEGAFELLRVQSLLWVPQHPDAPVKIQGDPFLAPSDSRSLASAIDAKDSYTYGYSERVARIAVELGRELDMDEDEIGDIYLAGLLHDIGKIGVSDAILGKRERLTPEEFEQIKLHTTIGYSILVDLRQIRNLLPGVLYHHEHYDGSGYPDGLIGEKIPLLARILAVADAYDAMSTTRPYRPAMPYERVEEILTAGAGHQWDKRVVDACLRCRHKIHAIRQRGVGESLRQAIDGVLRKDHSSILSIASGPLPLQGERVGN